MAVTTTYEPVLTPRVRRQIERQQRRLRELGARIVYDPDEVHEFWSIAAESYAHDGDVPAVLRKARFLDAFARRAHVHVEPDDPIVGSMRFASLGRALVPERAAAAEHGFGAAGGHIVVHYALVVRHGVDGLVERLDRRVASLADADPDDPRRVNAEAFRIAIEAFSCYVGRHAEAVHALAHETSDPEHAALADDLDAIARGPAHTFRQALQAVRFAHSFLHAEDPSAAISFGRLDRCLWPYLEADLDAGRITHDRAFELVCAFWVTCAEGDESQNVVVGGSAPDGTDQTNPLSLMMVDATLATRAFQPSLSVRFHPRMPPEFEHKSLELARQGFGQPSMFNDPVVVDSLVASGFPADRAHDWSVVGCYEATPNGDTYGMTVLACFPLVDALWNYLTGEPDWQDFDAFVAGLERHLRVAYRTVLSQAQDRWNHYADACPSPFKSMLMDGCVESLRPVEQTGARFNYAGINVLGLGTVVDSLVVIADRVFTRRDLTPDDLLAALRDDWPDERLRQSLKCHPGKYGTDADRSNTLAERLSRFIATMVLDSRMDHGVRPYPGLFAFGADIHRLDHPSPDGRRRADVISYGVGPSTIAPAMAHTAILRSASHAAHRLCACGCPMLLSLSPSDVEGGPGLERLRDLVRSCFRMGGFHLHVNVVRADDLRDAQAHPDHHADLLVRVSGFSARFVGLDKPWQDALIQRTARGL